MTKRIAVIIVVITLGMAVVAGAAPATGKIAGIARDAQNNAFTAVKVQLRNADTGQLVGTTKAGPGGAFEFTGLNPGNLVVELVDNSGKIVGLSSSTALAAGGTITGLVVPASAAGAQAGATAAGGTGSFFTSTGGILLLVGIGVGVTAAIIAVTDDSSPSR